jgi:antitoxin YefM
LSEGSGTAPECLLEPFDHHQALLTCELAPHPRGQWDSARSGGGRRGARSATIVVMTTESLRAVRDHLSEVIDRVEHQHERVVITRNGRAAAVLISPEDLEALEETLSVLNDPEALADIREADAAYARGDVTRGVEAVRQLRQ